MLEQIFFNTTSNEIYSDLKKYQNFEKIPKGFTKKEVNDLKAEVIDLLNTKYNNS